MTRNGHCGKVIPRHIAEASEGGALKIPKGEVLWAEVPLSAKALRRSVLCMCMCKEVGDFGADEMRRA